MYKVKIKSETGWSGIISVKEVGLTKKEDKTELKLKSDSDFNPVGGLLQSQSFCITNGEISPDTDISVGRIQKLIVDGKEIIDDGEFVSDDLF